MTDGINWEILEFTARELVLQINLQKQDQNAGSEEKLRLTFWGTKYFKDSFGRSVPFGTRVGWTSYRQAKPD